MFLSLYIVPPTPSYTWNLVCEILMLIYAHMNMHAYDALRRALRMPVGRMEQCQHCWFSGSQKNNTWLVETLQYMLSTFELFVVLFCSLGFYGGLTSSLFSLSESLASAAFSTRFCTWLRQVRTLRRASRAVLPVLHRREASPQLRPPAPSTSSSINARFNDAFLSMSVNWHSERDLKLTFPSDTANWHS